MKRCQAKASSTGKKCRLWPIEGHDFCRIHVGQLYPVKDEYLNCDMVMHFPSVSLDIKKTDSPNILPFKDEGITIPKDMWNLIFDNLTILDIRMINMSCQFMRAFVRAYWNSNNKERCYALASMDGGGNIIKGDFDTPFGFTHGVSITSENYNTYENTPCVLEMCVPEGDNVMGWKGVPPTSVYRGEIFNLYSRINNHKMFLKFCKKLSTIPEESILMAESKGEVLLLPPDPKSGIILTKISFDTVSAINSMRMAAMEFADALVETQLWLCLQEYGKLTRIKIQGSKLSIKDNMDILRKVKIGLRLNEPEAEIVIIDGNKIMSLKTSSFV
jgi:hypothetical protein